jgi:site-specific recombinase XerD
LAHPILSDRDRGQIGALDDWLHKRRKKSPETIRTYRNGVARFASWLIDNDNPAEVEAVTRDHVQAWVDEMEADGLRGNTILTYLRAVSQFFAWAEDVQEWIDRSPVRKIERDTRRKDAGPARREELTPAEVEAMLDTALGKDPSFIDRRNYALIHLLYTSGMRRGEVEALEVADIEPIDVPGSEWGAKVSVRRSKTGPRHTFVTREAWEALDTYITLRTRRKGWRSKGGDALFVGERGPLSGAAMEKIVARVADKAGIERKVHPHLFRHTWAGMMARRLEADPQEKDPGATLMRLGGWSQRFMADHYLSASAGNRIDERFLGAA